MRRIVSPLWHHVDKPSPAIAVPRFPALIANSIG
jgi:hypothetical protein